MIDINRTYLLKDGQYVQVESKKTKICIHHTVGGTAKSTIDYWNSTPDRVAVSYVIERDGTIYEAFDPKYWAYGLGLKPEECIVPDKYSIPVASIEKSTIGIELASEGALIYNDDKLHNFRLGNIYKGTGYIKLDKVWRGYQYFDQYEPAMLNSLYGLIDYLMVKFPTIERKVLSTYNTIDVSKFETFSGVFGHYHIRTTKTDPHLQFSWEDVSNRCKLIKVNQLNQVIVDADKLKPASYKLQKL